MVMKMEIVVMMIKMMMIMLMMMMIIMMMILELMDIQRIVSEVSSPPGFSSLQQKKLYELTNLCT